MSRSLRREHNEPVAARRFSSSAGSQQPADPLALPPIKVTRSNLDRSGVSAAASGASSLPATGRVHARQHRSDRAEGHPKTLWVPPKVRHGQGRLITRQHTPLPTRTVGQSGPIPRQPDGAWQDHQRFGDSGSLVQLSQLREPIRAPSRPLVDRAPTGRRGAHQAPPDPPSQQAAVSPTAPLGDTPASSGARSCQTVPGRAPVWPNPLHTPLHTRPREDENGPETAVRGHSRQSV